ncbi:MAG TPA: single-stranded-DNA-specific exonuclease RecJ [Verrucomicrobiae bacterium]
MTARWHFAPPSSAISDLAAAVGVPPLFAQCLVNRGCSDAQVASEFLSPKLARLSDPFLLPDMDRAVDRLLLTHKNSEPFVIFGDYDVDGVTATALLTEFFRALGWQCSYYLPHRLEEGYGLSADGVENCLTKHPVKLLLAVDCGSSAADVIASLAARGVEVLVLDHHQVSSLAPAAHSLVNPQLLTSNAHLKNLCSAGLAFKLAHAILKRCRDLNWPQACTHDLKQYLDFVALGTIADIVPLKDENRILVRCGLERLARTARIGLKALKKVAGLNGSIDCYGVSFQLAPRLNAAGRLETALDALDLLLTTEEARAEFLAQALDAQNRERQSIERKIADEVIEAVRTRFNPAADYAIVEGDASWHLGVVGIVASRVVREFHRPTLILGSDGTDNWRGSGRSIDGFDLAASLRQCSDLLVKHGGHAMAAGVTILATKLPDLRTRFNELARTTLSTEALLPLLKLDAEVRLSDLTFSFLKSLEQIEPFGQGNPCVQFAARGLRCTGTMRRLGSAEQHLRFNVTDGFATQQAVWWNCELTELPASFDLAFAPEFSEYNGTLAIQLRVLDLKPT